ncbi:MAG: hypothetical protein AB8H79_04185 [Myxococcota bacterium]
MLVRTVLASIGGLALGAGGAWFIAPGAQPAAEEPCENSLQVVRKDAKKLEQELTQLSEHYNERWRQRVIRMGQTLAWPESVPDPLKPEPLRAHLESVMQAHGGELLELDCNAYPCVAIARWHSEPEEMQLISSAEDGALFPGSMLAELTMNPDYNGRPLVEIGSIADAGAGHSVHGFAWYDTEDIRMSKRQSPEDIELNGSRVEQIRGGNEAVFQSWSDREQP